MKYEVQYKIFKVRSTKYEVRGTKYGIRSAVCNDIGLGGLSYATDIREGPSNGMHWQVRIPSLGFLLMKESLLTLQDQVCLLSFS